MTRLIERVLNLQRGDLGRGLLLFSYLFLVIASYVIGKVARDALFLDKFQAVQLPYADIASALLVGLVVSGYVRISRHVGLRDLLVGSLLLFAANAAIFWWLAHFYRFDWLYPLIYIWVGIYGVLAPAQAWTLANYVLTTREAKRVFGLVGGGAITGWIFAGFFSRVAAKRFGTESMLLGMAFYLAICAVLVVLIWRQRQPAMVDLGESASGQRAGGGEAKGVGESLKLVWSQTYLRAIAAVICLSSFVTTVAGWQFKAIAKQFLVQKDKLAIFFGDFNFYAGLLCLVTQLLLTSRVLKRFGIGPALFVVPLGLMTGSTAVLALGSLAAAVFLKGSDQVLRYSIDKSTVELLYLPVPASVKIQVKSFIDTVIWRLGDGLAGVVVLIFATYWHWSARRVSWVNLVLILGWITAAFVARRQYVAMLRESIQKHRLDAERVTAPVLDRTTTDILASSASLSAVDAGEILYALGLFEMGQKPSAHPAIRHLLLHPAPEVRRKAVSLLAAAGDKTVLPQIEGLLKDPYLEVRTEALLYLTHHAHVDPLERIQELGDFEDFSIRSAFVAFLARPGPTQNLVAARLVLDGMVKESGPEGKKTRLEAARLLGELPDHFEQQLKLLLGDPDLEVARAAVRAVGSLRNRRFVPEVIERLAQPEVRADAAEALAGFGDQIVGTLRDHLSDPAAPMEMRREIPAALTRIGTQAAEGVLAENMLETDTSLRFRVISALNKMHQQHPELEVDTPLVETVLLAEIMGHYRSYQILGTLGGSLEGGEAMVKALGESMKQEVERVFRLLALLFPRYDFHSAYVGLQATNIVVHDNALEFLDNVLKPQMRNVLVPLFDSDVSVGERVERANRLLGAKVETREEAAAALVYSDDPWLKSCGAYAIGSFGLKSLEKELDNCLNHPDPLLRETARQAKLRLAGVAQTAGA